MNRRDLLKMAGAAGLTVWQLPAAASILQKKEKRNFIWLVLRGGMDSLHAVVPAFDTHLEKHRGALVAPIQHSLLPLEKGFALHPELKFLHGLYKQKQLLPVVAVSTPYRKRSHFDGQDLLESGKATIDLDSGWLGRALSERQSEGLAIARSIPISFRGREKARTWYPSNLPDAEDDLFARLMGLYEQDPKLKQRLAEAIETQAMVGDMETKGRAKFATLAKSCASLLKDANGPECAMLEMGGWDTHNNLIGRMNNQFKQLDQGMQDLKSELGEQWRNTVVVVATEFGRTVKINGTRGSDHGTGTAMFLSGGAISGGKVLGRWPGLADANLFEGRDLQPTSDTFSWAATALQQHWGLSNDAMARIFPDTQLRADKLVL